MEHLKYIIEDSTIAELLGVQNFFTDEAAVLELIKNAYDANALNITLEFFNNRLIIIDDGNGMNYGDIKKHWMHIGKSDKGYETIDINNNKRVQAGSKGVGRFALSRLGRNIKLFSKKLGEKGVIWNTDWNESILDYDLNNDKIGTCIVINELREKWNKNRIKRLNKYLEKTYNDTVMKIRIISDGYDDVVNLHFPKPQPGVNCRSNIVLNYNKGILQVKVSTDEYMDEAKKYCPDIDLRNYHKEISILDEFKGNEVVEIVGEELAEKINKIGKFSANLFFNLTVTKLDKEKFLYKYLNTPKNIESGVVLYRNAFSISSYEGEKDWLGLGKRSRKSPAAASHPTGAWRVRENQISGYVKIDKKENTVLQDLMNRQGLDENIYYQLFIQIILAGIKEFERYRQKIIRKINLKNKIEKKSEKKVSDAIIRNPQIFGQLNEEEVSKLVDEIKIFKQAEKKLEKEKANAEARYKYDVRILNVLATIGLKASSIAHEMKTDRNTMHNNYNNIINALKVYGLWDELNLPENTVKYYKNVPSLLERMNDVGKKIILFMDTMLSEIEKKQFEIISHNIENVLSTVKKIWMRDYVWVNIVIEIEESITFDISEDIIRVILDNLILNSIQQNENNSSMEIKIKVKLCNGILHFTYSDNGRGLDKKYFDNPNKILEVHETTRINGHGLGMWIINNTIIMSGGEIQGIEGSNGFKIKFTLGGKINGEDKDCLY